MEKAPRGYAFASLTTSMGPSFETTLYRLKKKVGKPGKDDHDFSE
jgi:hypothetical protein